MKRKILKRVSSAVLISSLLFISLGVFTGNSFIYQKTHAAFSWDSNYSNFIQWLNNFRTGNLSRTSYYGQNIKEKWIGRLVYRYESPSFSPNNDDNSAGALRRRHNLYLNATNSPEAVGQITSAGTFTESNIWLQPCIKYVQDTFDLKAQLGSTSYNADREDTAETRTFISRGGVNNTEKDAQSFNQTFPILKSALDYSDNNTGSLGDAGYVPNAQLRNVYCNVYDYGYPATWVMDAGEIINGRTGLTSPKSSWRNTPAIISVITNDTGAGIGDSFAGEGRKYRMTATDGDSNLNQSCNGGIGYGHQENLSTNADGQNREGDIRIYFCNEDRAGNINNQQNRGDRLWRVDQFPPDIPVIVTSSHQDGVWLNDDNIQINVTKTNAGPSTATNQFCFEPGTGTCNNFSETTTSNNFSRSNVADGVYKFAVRTYDVGGTSTASATMSIRIDTTPSRITFDLPEITFTTPGPHRPYPAGTGGWTNDADDVRIQLTTVDSDPGNNSGLQFSRSRWERSENMSACVTGTNFGAGDRTEVTSIPSQGEYYHALCVRDVADITTEIFSGLYQYDNSVPEAPSITSSIFTRDDWNTVGDGVITINNSDVFNYTATGGNGSIGPSPYEMRYCVSKTSNCDPQSGTAVTSLDGNFDIPQTIFTDGTWYISTLNIETEFGTSHVSPIETFMFRVDTELPIHEAFPPNRLSWLDASTLNIELTGSDPIKDTSASGIARSRYVVNQSTINPFNADCTGGGTDAADIPAIHTDFADGTTYIHTCSIDIAGNTNITSTDRWGFYLVDLTPPTIIDDYGINAGVWQNTSQIINFEARDAHSGIRDVRYTCSGIGCPIPSSGSLGGTAVGENLYEPSLSFTASSVDAIVTYETEDWAGNISIEGTIEIKIDLIRPTFGSLSYYNGWDNDTIPNQRDISYRVNDTGGSGIETVTLQVGECPVSGACNPTSWNPAFSVNNQSGNVYNYTFPQKFDNRKSYMYQVIYSDEAGNNGVVGTSTNILRMENEDPEATISNNDINVSANGWTNITAQGISIDFSDTGGSGLQSYTLQISDVIDTSATPTFANLGNPTTWANVVGHTNRVINGDNDTSTYTFTGVNKHAYMFRVMVTDIAGNTSLWLESTDSPIKIDTDVPSISDVSSPTENIFMATNAENLILDFGRNGGAPIVDARASFEDYSQYNDSYLGSVSSDSDDNPTILDQIDRNYNIQDVDGQREADPLGYREYSYRIDYIEDEAGNMTPTGSVGAPFTYQVYANSYASEIGTEELDRDDIDVVTVVGTIADGTSDRIIARIEDRYGNAYVRADSIGRAIAFDFSSSINLWLNQYTKGGGVSAEMQTSNTSGFIDITTRDASHLTDLSYISGSPGEYAFDFRAYTPTANAYTSTTSVSDPDSEFVIEDFQYAVQHDPGFSVWDTGDRSLDNGSSIDFRYFPLFTTAFSGDIEQYGFIEGANQDSLVTILKANSNVVLTNNEALILEFGVNDGDPTPDMKLETYPGPRTTPEGFNDGNTIYETFNLNTPNSSFPFPIDSLLIMERGFELLERQERYLSTHIRYNLDGKDIKYNSDIIGKDNYYGNGLGNNTIQTGLKVLGQTHSRKQKDIITDQEGKDLSVIGDIYKASLKKDIVKNAFTIIRNADPDWIFGGARPEVRDLRDFSQGNNDGKSLFNGNVLYFGDDGTNARVNINPSGNASAEVNGKKTILAYGRNIYIESNIYYNNNNQDILGIIALSDENGNGGNIYIDPDITNIVGTMFAEKSVISFDADGAGELGGGTDQETLKNQLHIYGSVFSENTIGGSRSNPITCPYYIDNDLCEITATSTSQEIRDAQNIAQKYDLNYLRRYFTYRNGTIIVPANEGKVIGGGDCDTTGDCDNWESYYARYITNTAPAIDTESGKYAVYPVVIEYNPSGQTNPAPLFEAE